MNTIVQQIQKEIILRLDDNKRRFLRHSLNSIGISNDNIIDFFFKERVTSIKKEGTEYYYLDYVDENNKGVFIQSINCEISSKQLPDGSYQVIIGKQ